MKDAGHPAHREQTQPALAVPSDLSDDATEAVAAAMNLLLADTFALYLKTKNFHWHMSGPHFRDWHLLLDEQAGEILAMTDPIAERVRKLGRRTLHGIGEVASLRRIADNDATFVEPSDMLAELCGDNRAIARAMREAHDLCDEVQDVATAGLLETWIDEAERRTWFLYETSHKAPPEPS